MRKHSLWSAAARQRLAPRFLASFCCLALVASAPAGPVGSAPLAAAGGQGVSKKPEATPANTLPTPDQVLAHYVKALGGEPALRKITSRVLKGTFEIDVPQLSGEAEIDMAGPDRFRSLLKIPDAGDILLAYDGKVGWASDPQNGLRDVTGTELDQLRLSSQFQHELRFRELFPKVRVLEKTTEEDHPAWVLEATPVGGSPEKFYFDAETGLLLRHDSTQASPDGDVPIEHRYSLYISVDGVQVPTLLRHKDAAREWRVKFTEIRNNVAIDPSLFEKPAAP